jgi:hypothetical protein
MAEIVNAAHKGAKVHRVDISVSDGVVTGTARHLVTSPELPIFPGRDDDIRDCFLRVTLTSGFEAFWLVSDLVTDLRNNGFMVEK